MSDVDVEKRHSLRMSDLAKQVEEVHPGGAKELAHELAQNFEPPSHEEVERLIRKLDWRLVPVVFILYSLAVLDRGNLGNARLAGLPQDINLSGGNCRS